MYVKTNWENLPSTNTPINATNLNKIETELETLDNYSIYSTTENLCGSWIDSKPIYRKVVSYRPSSTIGSEGTVTHISVAHGIQNLKYVIKIDLNFYNDEGSTGMIPNLLGSTENVKAGTAIQSVDSTNIYLRIINDSWSAARTFYFVLEYTKTTD